MKIAARCFSLSLLSLSLLFLVGCKLTGSEDSQSQGLKIGAAEIDITPPVGHRMAGYFDERLATGVHDPLKAKAIVMKQGDEQIALVFCDLVGVSLNVTTNARSQASDKTGIPASHIVMSASHSHTGPLFEDTRRHYFHEAALAKYGTDPREKIYYPDFLIDRLVKVIAKAQSRLHPAELEVGIAKQENLTFNRRYWMKDGKVRFNPGQLNPNIVRPAGPTDSDVGILLARELKSRKSFAGATIFAMHCDTVGGAKYSADYPFFLQETLRKAFGNSFISAFGAGTCGDLNHIDVNRKDTIKGFPMAEYLGSTLGQTVLAASNNLRPISNPSFKVLSSKIDVPLQETTPEQLADAHTKISKLGDTNTDFFVKVVAVKILDLEHKQNPYPMEVQVFRFDFDTALVCLPCEIFVELGLAIKQGSPFKNTIVQSICNDRPSYVPTKKAFTEGSYEVTNARVKSGAGEMLVDTALKLLKEAKN